MIQALSDTFSDSTRSISNVPASLEFELGTGDFSPVAYADAAKYTVDGAKEFAGIYIYIYVNACVGGVSKRSSVFLF
jgi:hypothetical protein